MNDTVRKFTFSLDKDRICQDVYAESACIALMWQTERPEIISGDNRKLLDIYIDNAVVELSANLAAYIDSASFRIPESNIVEIPFLIPVGCEDNAPIVRMTLEKAVSSAVLMRCYEPAEDLRDVFAERCRRYRSHILHLLLPRCRRMGDD